jgi:drug/metabolite transporter (DMT)-like permease
MVARFGNRGAVAGLAAAALFGVATPVAKALLGQVGPWLLAGVLYTAAGIALFGWRAVRRAARVQVARRDLAPLLGAVLFGGVIAPVLLMVGLSAMPATGASLLLTTEGLFTALIAWLVFREATDRRIVLGFGLIAAGVVVLSWPGQPQWGSFWPAVAVLGACLSWGIDNNLTRRVATYDATWLAGVKGAVAGPVNLLLAFALGAQLPSVPVVAGAALVGVLSYGISLVFFIRALELVGTARAGAYFSVAPFFGAALAVVLGEPFTWQLGVAAALMAAGLLLHLSEHHEHSHTHEARTHDHEHEHGDGHHDHGHNPSVSPGTRHRHSHSHDRLTHDHPHFPDTDHIHRH